MKKLYLLLLLFVAKVLCGYAQENDPWVLGIGMNVVDNSGSRFEELMDIENNWNLSQFIKATVEKRFEYDYGIELTGSLNRFEKSKKINSQTNDNNVNYFAVDIMLKDYFTNYWSDPRKAKYTGYIIGGWGGNFFDGIINNSLNIGFGLNRRINFHTWLSFQTLGKFSIDDNTPGNANHLQHSVTVIFWLHSKKKKKR